MIRVSLRQWQVFAQTAATGSLRAAAATLHITQPAASMALAEMERLLGAPLFDRQRNRLHVNALGRQLLPPVQDLLARHAELERIAAGDTVTPAGELRIGASENLFIVFFGVALDRNRDEVVRRARRMGLLPLRSDWRAKSPDFDPTRRAGAFSGSLRRCKSSP